MSEEREPTWDQQFRSALKHSNSMQERRRFRRFESRLKRNLSKLKASSRAL